MGLFVMVNVERDQEEEKEKVWVLEGDRDWVWEVVAVIARVWDWERVTLWEVVPDWKDDLDSV